MAEAKLGKQLQFINSTTSWSLINLFTFKHPYTDENAHRYLARYAPPEPDRSFTL